MIKWLVRMIIIVMTIVLFWLCRMFGTVPYIWSVGAVMGMCNATTCDLAKTRTENIINSFGVFIFVTLLLQMWIVFLMFVPMPI